MFPQNVAQVQVDGLHNTQPKACGSDQTLLGPLDITCSKPPNMAEEQFLAMLRFEQRGKLAELTDSLSGAGTGSVFP